MVALKNTAANVMAIAAVAGSANAGLLGSTSSTTSSTTSAVGTEQRNGCYYSVPGVGLFTTQMSYTWNNAVTLLANGVGSNGDLVASVYTVGAGNSPLPRRFDVTNIGVSTSFTDPCLTMTVPGGQSTGPVSSSQLTTSYSDILYGTVRTVAKISAVAGTTHGFSFYSNDTQEVDFAFLTSDPSVAHLTNEQTSSSAVSSTYSVAAPSDATSAYHEYRVDWLPGKTNFYIDAVLVGSSSANVPTTPGFWLWNNWSNGNAWAQGPPKSNSVLKIRSIDAYFNRTSVLASYSGGKSCSV